MGIAFISIMVMDFPSLKAISNGLIPKLPGVSSGSDNSSMVVLTGMVGTTVSTFVFIIRTQLVKEKGWKARDQKLQLRDARVSASLMFIISSAVMITAANTLYVKGIKLNHVAEMVDLMVPIAGEGAMTFLVIGIVAAGISSHLPNLLVIQWLIIDYKDEKRDTSKIKYRIILTILSVISAGGVLFGFKPVFILLLSQACLAIVLPLTVGAIFYLTSKKSIMNSHVNGLKEYIILGLVMLFSLYMGAQGFIGLIEDLL
jgi:Mn2+/Fe2+ NRAMP family transporter